MNKHISTAAAALALIGAIGLASAQSDSAVPPVDPASAATTDSSMSPADTTMTDSTMDTERAPQADRN